MNQPKPSDYAALTPREVRALEALVDKRAAYTAQDHPVAAGVMGMAIWLVWQIFSHVPCQDEPPEQPPPGDSA